MNTKVACTCITSSPSLLHQILEYTPNTDPDYESLLLALQASETLCSQVNDGVRAKENAESLEWLQSHVHVTLNEVQLCTCTCTCTVNIMYMYCEYYVHVCVSCKITYLYVHV